MPTHTKVYKSSKQKQSNHKRPPAKTPEARERQLIALATDLAAKQMAEGTASSQVITHYLRLATKKAKLENEILERQKDLITAKTEAMQSVKRIEELTNAALAAMRSYTGTIEEE